MQAALVVYSQLPCHLHVSVEARVMPHHTSTKPPAMSLRAVSARTTARPVSLLAHRLDLNSRQVTSALAFFVAKK